MYTETGLTFSSQLKYRNSFNQHSNNNLVNKIFLPNLKAALAAASVPHKVIICAKLVMSSYALKKGYLPLSMERNMTPADQMSTAVDW